MPMIVLNKKKFLGVGGTTVRKLIGRIGDELGKKFSKYAQCTDGEQAFWFGESQTKGYVTAVLDGLCGGYLMQEYPVARLEGDTPRSGGYDYTDRSSGRVDYYCVYYDGDSGVSLLVEVKQYWIRFFPDPDKSRFTVYAEGVRRHETAKEQLKKIGGKQDFKVGKRLYGVALSIMPVFSRHKSDEEKVSPIGEEDSGTVLGAVRKKLGAHAVDFLPSPKSAIRIWPTVDNTFESYPGVVLAWSLLKLSK